MATAPAYRSISIPVNGVRRKAILLVPSVEPEDLIIGFHGSHGSGKTMAEKWVDPIFRNYLVICPTALEHRDPKEGLVRRWFLPWQAPLEPTADAYADEALTLKIIEYAKRYYPSVKRVYAAGFSSGAGMTQDLAIRYSILFNGFAPGSHGLAEPLANGPQEIPFEPRPFQLTFGTEDPNYAETTLGGQVVMSGPDTMAWWVKANGHVPPGESHKVGSREITNWPTPAQGYARFVQVIGGRHTWYTPAEGADFDESQQAVDFWISQAGMRPYKK